MNSIHKDDPPAIGRLAERPEAQTLHYLLQQSRREPPWRQCQIMRAGWRLLADDETLRQEVDEAADELQQLDHEFGALICRARAGIDPADPPNEAALFLLEKAESLPIRAALELIDGGTLRQFEPRGSMALSNAFLDLLRHAGAFDRRLDLLLLKLRTCGFGPAPLEVIAEISRDDLEVNEARAAIARAAAAEAGAAARAARAEAEAGAAGGAPARPEAEGRASRFEAERAAAEAAAEEAEKILPDLRRRVEQAEAAWGARAPASA